MCHQVFFCVFFFLLLVDSLAVSSKYTIAAEKVGGGFFFPLLFVCMCVCAAIFFCHFIFRPYWIILFISIQGRRAFIQIYSDVWRAVRPFLAGVKLIPVACSAWTCFNVVNMISPPVEVEHMLTLLNKTASRARDIFDCFYSLRMRFLVVIHSRFWSRYWLGVVCTKMRSSLIIWDFFFHVLATVLMSF